MGQRPMINLQYGEYANLELISERWNDYKVHQNKSYYCKNYQDDKDIPVFLFYDNYEPYLRRISLKADMYDG